MPGQPSILAALHWQYAHAAIVVAPTVVVLAAYVFWAYLPQVLQAGRRRVWGLAALRFTAFATLGAALLRPSVTRPRTPAERGPVVFLIDDSRSMEVIDTGRLPGQRVALAAALGRLPAGARDTAAVHIESATEQLAPLTDAIARARAELAYARLAGRDADAATARLDAAIDALRQSAKTLSDAVAATGGVQTARLDRMLGLLATTPAAVDRETWLDRAGDRARSAAAEAANARSDADARLYDDDPDVHDAANGLAGQPREKLAWAAVFDPHAGLLARLGAGMPASAYTIGDRVTPILGDADVPVPEATVSDLAGGVRAVLDRLAANPTAEPPRAVVLLSDGRQVNGSSPESVAALAAGVPVHTVAIAGRTASTNVAVTDLSVPRRAYPGEPTMCRVNIRPTAASGLSTVVTFDAGGDRQSRRVEFVGDRPVALAFTWVPRTPGPTRVVVQADPVEDEATDADNVADAWSVVVGNPVRVVAFSPTVVLPAATTCAAMQAMPNVQLIPAGLSQVGNADVAVLFDVTAKSLTAGQWEGVTRLVSERGGGVILIPPDTGFGPAVSPSSPLGRLLPYVGPPTTRAAHPTGRFQNTTDLLALSENGAENTRRWGAITPFDSYLPLSPLRPDARSLLSADDTSVLAERTVGAGRAICVASDQMWRWRGGPRGTQDFDRIWAALLREAAGEPYATAAGGIALDSDAFAISPGQAVHLRAKTSDALPRSAVILRVLDAAGRLVKTTPFHSRSGGRFDLMLSGLPSGNYVLEVDAGGPVRPHVPLEVQPSSQAELADVSGDEAFLHRLSDATGGESFRLDQLDAVAAQLAAPDTSVSRPIELPLWDGPYLYAGILGLLTTEWALRRRAGLA